MAEHREVPLINGYIIRVMLLPNITFHRGFISVQIFLWKLFGNIWEGLKMKIVKTVLSVLIAIAFIVTFSDLLQYLLLFPAKSVKVIFVLLMVSMVWLLVSIYLRNPKSTTS
ncbi:hypothetical protein CEX98_14320 [Pseudoalteromonas piscicida]|uniref:Uncharacterized protein n=1 Tax=Pseudoalteromonas piscicida TaxID=43662 RepID=A0A2A5JNQ9_PSEO7|nr:hypothetical protein CEX98_14320 [Pseudoalteromonas piscicida]